MDQTETGHTIHCTCGHEQTSLMRRVYEIVRPPARTRSCPKAQKWLEHSHLPEFPVEVYEEILGSYMDSREFHESIKQINLDIKRTYPDESYFSTGGQEVLRHVLMAYAKYDVELGYVQGMNFIVASLLWHASESDAFWLFVRLIEDFELREIFQLRLPGVAKHCQIIQLLTFEALPELSGQFARYQITTEMFLAEWCVTLFGSVVPVSEMVNILDSFFSKGWLFFYRFVLILLGYLEVAVRQAKDYVEFMTSLKLCKNTQREWHELLRKLTTKNNKADWETFLKRAGSVSLDEQYISYLHLHFNVDTAQFSIRRIR